MFTAKQFILISQEKILHSTGKRYRGSLEKVLLLKEKFQNHIFLKRTVYKYFLKC